MPSLIIIFVHITSLNNTFRNNKDKEHKRDLQDSRKENSNLKKVCSIFRKSRYKYVNAGFRLGK